MDARKVAINSAHAGLCDITETCLGILVDTCGKAMESEVWRKVSIVIVIAKRVNVRLECGDRISEFGVLNSP